jgi:hypothetical protein
MTCCSPVLRTRLPGRRLTTEGHLTLERVAVVRRFGWPVRVRGPGESETQRFHMSHRKCKSAGNPRARAPSLTLSACGIAANRWCGDWQRYCSGTVERLLREMSEEEVSKGPVTRHRRDSDREKALTRYRSQAASRRRVLMRHFAYRAPLSPWVPSTTTVSRPAQVPISQVRSRHGAELPAGIRALYQESDPAFAHGQLPEGCEMKQQSSDFVSRVDPLSSLKPTDNTPAPLPFPVGSGKPLAVGKAGIRRGAGAPLLLLALPVLPAPRC